MITQQFQYSQPVQRVYQSTTESPISESETPIEGFPCSISESGTPVEDNGNDVDADQLRLRLYIQQALRGDNKFPQWEGLAGALQRYFAQGWQRDRFSLEYCEKAKEFLFWNAVGDMKMKESRGC